MTSVELDLFQNTKVDMAKDNLTNTKRRALTNWRRDNLFNKESDTDYKIKLIDLLLWTKALITLRHINKLGIALLLNLIMIQLILNVTKVKEWADK